MAAVPDWWLATRGYGPGQGDDPAIISQYNATVAPGDAISVPGAPAPSGGGGGGGTPSGKQPSQWQIDHAHAIARKARKNRTAEEQSWFENFKSQFGPISEYGGGGTTTGNAPGKGSGKGNGGLEPPIKNKDGEWTQAEKERTGFKTYKAYLNWWNNFTTKTEGIAPGEWKRQYGLSGRMMGLDPYERMASGNDAAKVRLINYTFGTNYGSLDEATNGLALAYGFAGLTQYRFNQLGRHDIVENNPNLWNVGFEDIRYDDANLGRLLGRAQEMAVNSNRAGQSADVLEDWTQLVPDWAGDVDANLQQQGIRFNFGLLSSPEINLYDPTKPLFKPGERPTSIFQLTGQQAGESAFYRGLSAAELMEQISPIYDSVANRPEGSEAPGQLTFGGETESLIKQTDAYKRWTALNQPGAAQGSGLISDPRTGIQWNPYTGEVQFLPGQRDQQSILMQEELVKAMQGQPYDPNRIGVLGQAIMAGDPDMFMSAVGSGVQGLLTDGDAMARLAAVINDPIQGGGVNAVGQNLTGGSPFGADGKYKFNIQGAPMVQTLDPALAPKDRNKQTQTPQKPAGTSVNPQLLPPTLPGLQNPAGAQTDSEYEAQRAGLTAEYQAAYAKVLQALGFTDPSTGQKLPGDVQIDAERIRQEALRNMGLAGEAVQGQFQRGGALFSGRYAEERARAEYPYVSGLADLDVSTSRTLAELYQQAAGLISEYENSNNLLLADLAKRRSQSTMIPVPGA